MDNIPVEILYHIFHYINTYELCEVVSKVCKQWNLVVMRHVMNIRDANELEMFHEGLRAVMVSDPVCNLYQASKLISCATQMIPRLKELTICYSFPLDDDDYKSLLWLPHLKHLDVFSKNQWMTKSTTISPTITTLVVNETMDYEFLQNLSKSKLSGFHMYGKAQFYGDVQMVQFLRVHAVTLQELTLRCYAFTDERFKIISQCVGLVSLRLYQCSLLTPRSIPQIAGLSKLRCLHLTGARLFHSLGILELINSLPLLIEDLNLSNSEFGNEHCTALAQRLPRLAVLELWRCGPPPATPPCCNVWECAGPRRGRECGLRVAMGIGRDARMGGDEELRGGMGLGRGSWPGEAGGMGRARGPWPGEGGGMELARGRWPDEGGGAGLGRGLGIGVGLERGPWPGLGIGVGLGRGPWLGVGIGVGLGRGPWQGEGGGMELGGGPWPGEGGVMDMVMDPLPGEDGGVVDPLPGEGGGAVDPLPGEGGGAELGRGPDPGEGMELGRGPWPGEGGLMELVMDPLPGEGGGAVDPLPGEGGDAVDPLPGEGGVMELVMDPLPGEGGGAVDPLPGEGGGAELRRGPDPGEGMELGRGPWPGEGGGMELVRGPWPGDGGGAGLGRGPWRGAGMELVIGPWPGEGGGVGLGRGPWRGAGIELVRGPWPGEGGGVGLGRGPWPGGAAGMELVRGPRPGEGGGERLGRGPWLGEGGGARLGRGPWLGEGGGARLCRGPWLGEGGGARLGRGPWPGEVGGVGIGRDPRPGEGGGAELGRSPWPGEGPFMELGRGPWPAEDRGMGMGRGPRPGEGGGARLSLPRLAEQLRHLRALDTDVVLDAQQLRALAEHPTLRRLRCLWNGRSQLVRSKLIITSAVREYPRMYLRDDGEGPSDQLFYYWTRGVDLQLLKVT